MTLCARCKKEGDPAPEKLPLPGPLANEVRERVCSTCWKEWEGMEVMVINELRLNFMDPESQTILHKRMREFFELDS